jgi:hypothetical protein
MCEVRNPKSFDLARGGVFATVMIPNLFIIKILMRNLDLFRKGIRE